MIRTIITILFLSALTYGQTNLIKVPASECGGSDGAARLVGMPGTRVAGDTIIGAYEASRSAFTFDVTTSGPYKLEYDENGATGGLSYSANNSWSGTYGRWLIGRTDSHNLFQILTTADTDNDGKIERTGLENDAVDSSVVKDGTITTADLKDSSVTLVKASTALLNFVGSGGSVTNNPDDVTLENKSGSTIGLKGTYIDTVSWEAYERTYAVRKFDQGGGLTHTDLDSAIDWAMLNDGAVLLPEPVTAGDTILVSGEGLYLRGNGLGYDAIKRADGYNGSVFVATDTLRYVIIENMRINANEDTTGGLPSPFFSFQKPVQYIEFRNVMLDCVATSPTFSSGDGGGEIRLIDFSAYWSVWMDAANGDRFALTDSVPPQSYTSSGGAPQMIFNGPRRAYLNRVVTRGFGFKFEANTGHPSELISMESSNIEWTPQTIFFVRGDSSAQIKKVSLLGNHFANNILPGSENKGGVNIGSSFQDTTDNGSAANGPEAVTDLVEIIGNTWDRCESVLQVGGESGRGKVKKLVFSGNIVSGGDSTNQGVVMGTPVVEEAVVTGNQFSDINRYALFVNANRGRIADNEFYRNGGFRRIQVNSGDIAPTDVNNFAALVLSVGSRNVTVENNSFIDNGSALRDSLGYGSSNTNPTAVIFQNKSQGADSNRVVGNYITNRDTIADYAIAVEAGNDAQVPSGLDWIGNQITGQFDFPYQIDNRAGSANEIAGFRASGNLLDTTYIPQATSAGVAYGQLTDDFVHTNEGASGTTTRTLPNGFKGFRAHFAVVAAHALRIDPNVNDKFIGQGLGEYMEVDSLGATIDLHWSTDSTIVFKVQGDNTVTFE